MYIVKTSGGYYVKDFKGVEEYVDEERTMLWIEEITFSRTMQKAFNRYMAEYIAKEVCGEVIKIKEEVTNE